MRRSLFGRTECGVVKYSGLMLFLMRIVSVTFIVVVGIEIFRSEVIVVSRIMPGFVVESVVRVKMLHYAFWRPYMLGISNLVLPVTLEFYPDTTGRHS